MLASGVAAPADGRPVAGVAPSSPLPGGSGPAAGRRRACHAPWRSRSRAARRPMWASPGSARSRKARRARASPMPIRPCRRRRSPGRRRPVSPTASRSTGARSEGGRAPDAARPARTDPAGPAAPRSRGSRGGSGWRAAMRMMPMPRTRQPETRRPSHPSGPKRRRRPWSLHPPVSAPPLPAPAVASDAPLRAPEAIGRIWITPFVDGHGIYREGAYVQVVLEPAGWRRP